MVGSNTKIFFCPRFHVNFYHSYRGDTPDERGFGKDIRVIRYILDSLDELSKDGIEVKCAWDFDNAFTLGHILPSFAPDIIERIKMRVIAGVDEIELMSWNNGLLTAHTPEELRYALSWAINAPDGSGVLQTFGSYVPIARPQECMFTGSHIDIYRSVGIEAISLYYSAIPFNAIGSFISELEARKRYNPLTLKNPTTGASIRLIPAINQGDLAEYYFSAARMLKAIRAEQLHGTFRCAHGLDAEGDPERDIEMGIEGDSGGIAQPVDMLVVLDIDADDSFWAGFLPGFSRRFVPSFGGLYSLIASIARLPFVGFERPWEYIKTHPDRGEIVIGQDMADGAFDGYSSWSEKYENYEIWSIIAEARSQWQSAKSIVAVRNGESVLRSATSPKTETYWLDELSELDPSLARLAHEAIKERLRALSTTHFGLAVPVMNVTRLEIARETANRSLELAKAFYTAVKHKYGVVNAISNLPCIKEPQELRGPELPQAAHPESRVRIQDSSPHSPHLTLSVSSKGRIRLASGPYTVHINEPWVEYNHKILGSRKIDVISGAERYELHGIIPLRPMRVAIEWSRTATMLSADLVCFELHVQYPSTPHRCYDHKKARTLGRTWDDRWRQLAPFEIVAFENLPCSTIIHVWKEDFSNVISHYSLDYAGYGRNRFLADINNHLTPKWLAVSDGARGILVAQASQSFSSYAFCPLRQDLRCGVQCVSMFPFGALWGPQYRYPAAVTGLGRRAAILTAEHLHSSAPSWEGKTLDARLLIALYEGNEPQRSLLAKVHECLL